MGDSVTVKYYDETSHQTPIILLFCLLGLVALLIFLYRKLNKDSNGEYTIRNMVYKEGGIRDQTRGVALAVGTRLGIQLWPRSGTEEYGEEMQDIQDEEAQVKAGDSQGSHSEGDDREEEEQHGETNGDEEANTSDDTTSLESAEVGEQTRLTGQPQANEGMEEKREDTQEKEAEEGNKGPGLLIDLNQFSGSAIWSGEEGGKRDVTAL